MPLYSYKCNKCDKIINKVHGINETLECCVDCSGPVNKLVNTFRTVEKDNKKLESKNRIEQYIKDSKQGLAEEIKEARKSKK